MRGMRAGVRVQGVQNVRARTQGQGHKGCRVCKGTRDVRV